MSGLVFYHDLQVTTIGTSTNLAKNATTNKYTPVASLRTVHRPVVADSRPGAACSRAAVAGRGGAARLSWRRSRAIRSGSPRPVQSSRSGRSSSTPPVSGIEM